MGAVSSIYEGLQLELLKQYRAPRKDEDLIECMERRLEHLADKKDDKHLYGLLRCFHWTDVEAFLRKRLPVCSNKYCTRHSDSGLCPRCDKRSLELQAMKGAAIER
jgi:hypothetical protein